MMSSYSSLKFKGLISDQQYKNIKIIKNNQYILNLNSITIDVDQINKDKSIMDINCSSLEDELVSPKKLYPEKPNATYS